MHWAVLARELIQIGTSQTFRSINPEETAVVLLVSALFLIECLSACYSGK